MKINMKYAVGMMALLIGAACSDDDVISTDAVLDTNQLAMEAVGGTQDVRVAIPGKWTAQPDASWIQVSPVNGRGTEVCTIKVDTTILANQSREAVVNFIAQDGNEAYTVSVTQKGYDKALTLSETTKELEDYADFGKRYFEVKVTSNVDFEIDIPEEARPWLSYDRTYKFNLDRGYTPRTTTIRFNWEGNTEKNAREALVNFKVKEEDLVKHDALSILQKRGPEITDDRKGDSLALVICERKLHVMQEWNKNEALYNWRDVKLWEETDKGCTPENLGRVRSVKFGFTSFMETGGTYEHPIVAIPEEISNLKYLETLSFFSNANPWRYYYTTGTAITELANLKNLQIFSYSLVSLPDEFKNLKNLEVLDLSSNCFQTLPAVLTPENFPKLKSLDLVANRRSQSDNLEEETRLDKEHWGGFFGEEVRNSFTENPVLKRLCKWDNLERLVLSNNILQGTIPTFTTYADRDIPRYTQADLDANPDTLGHASILVTNKIPKVLPKCKDLRIGLNYLNGKVPDWMMYHPYLPYWSPDTSIFGQHKWNDTFGKEAGFTNYPENYDYYYEQYPVYLEE